MARIGGGGVPLSNAPRILYQDVAELESLKSNMDTATGGAQSARIVLPRGMFKEALARSGRFDPLAAPPPLPAGRTQRPDAREMQNLVRGLLQRHEGLSEVRADDTRIDPGTAADPAARMLAALRTLVDTRDQLEIRLAQTTKA